MATLSDGLNMAVLAKVESTYNTDPTLAGGTDDVLAIDSPNPVSISADTIQVRPHATSFTKKAKDIIGPRLFDVSFQFMLQGTNENTSDPATNGFTGIDALFRSAGMTSTDGTNTMTYAPTTIATQESAYLKFDTGGVVYDCGGTYGNITFSGSGGSPGLLCSYTGQSMYTAPSIDTISGFVGPDYSEPFLGEALSITPDGGSAYNAADGLICDSFEFSTGLTISRVEDCGDATGLSQLRVTDRNPTLRLTIALDANDSANLDFEDLFPDLTGRVDHAVTLVHGAFPNKWTFTIGTAQLVGVTPGEKNGYRTATLDYKVRHATAESEFSIALAGQ